MQHQIPFSSGYSVYPGEYVPLFMENDFHNKKSLPERNKNILPFSIDELERCYKLELLVPGVRRENILLSSQRNNLYLTVAHNNMDTINREKLQLPELNLEGCLNHKIVLPDNADTLFISAEYKGGILCLYIPKSTHPTKWSNAKIAIY